MEPAWDELTEAFANSKSKLIGEIDCTSEEGQELCRDMNVKSYPTLKFGDVFELQEYEGPRDFESLKKFSDKQLKPQCGINHVQLCDKATRKEIRRLKSLTLAEIDKELTAKTDSINQIEAQKDAFVADLEAQYEAAMTEKDAAVKEIMDSGLAMMKTVAAERGIKIKPPPKKQPSGEEEYDDEMDEYY